MMRTTGSLVTTSRKMYSILARVAGLRKQFKLNRPRFPNLPPSLASVLHFSTPYREHDARHLVVSEMRR
jgi:hypothetical protein